jgi:hypothetical protein
MSTITYGDFLGALTKNSRIVGSPGTITLDHREENLGGR